MTSRDPDSPAAGPDDDLRAQAEAAEERAEAARARADELRRQLKAAEDAEAAETGQPAETAPPAAAGRPGARRLATVVLTALLTAGLLAATGFMLFEHHRQSRQHQQAAEYAAAARQGLINLMSIDYATADDSVKRVVDGSTGRFRANFEETSDEFVKALKDEKIVTKATVNDAAVESMTDDSAVVLLSATSRREGPQAPKDQQQPRLWRVVLSLQRDGDQIKMSGVEFV